MRVRKVLKINAPMSLKFMLEESHPFPSLCPFPTKGTLNSEVNHYVQGLCSCNIVTPLVYITRSVPPLGSWLGGSGQNCMAISSCN